VGSFGGGRFADANAARSLIVGTIGVAVSLVALYLFGEIAFVVALALFALGLFEMGMAPSLQYRVVELAGPGGLAIGAFTASAAVITGLVIAVTAIAAALATNFLKPVAAAPAPQAMAQIASEAT
jgi:DHA1 family inner membrane transport protein